MSRRYQQWAIAVFLGSRATDLVAVFTAIAQVDGDAIQQAYDFIRDAGHDPAQFQYQPIASPASIRRGRPR